MIPHNHNRKVRRPRMAAVRNKQPHGELYRTDLLVVWDMRNHNNVNTNIQNKRGIKG